MNKQNSIALFWFRRDLRLFDNAGLFSALKENSQVLPLFIFDKAIIDELPSLDLRVQFIHETVSQMKTELKQKKSDLLVEYGDVESIFKKIFSHVKISAVYTNHDYEPKARKRDQVIQDLCSSSGVEFKTFKDQTIFEKSEILSDAGKPYTVYTPYKKKWLSHLSKYYLKSYPNDLYENHYIKIQLSSLGFNDKMITLEQMNKTYNPNFNYPEPLVIKKTLENYQKNRDFPADPQGTSKLGLHLRFGTVSCRELAREGQKHSDVWLSELIWRDFFMQILWHFPHVEKESFRPQYEKIKWRFDQDDFNRWKNGQTGYALVDAGMRELNQTGHMHNRVRMLVASFLTKHLLHHWIHGERYFAEKLLDFDLSANNGNWQWAAGTGCDAAPYFRVFNPQTQLEKFDPDLKYVKKWVPEYGSAKYIQPMVEHTFARNRALEEFKKGLT